MTRLTGPHSYCSTQEFGLLTDGFDSRPAAFQSHNPPYYLDLLSAAGFTPDFRTDTFSYFADRDADQLRRLVRRGEAVVAQQGLRVRSLEPARWEREIDLIHELLSASFGANHDMVPMSRAVLGFQTDEIRPFLDPRLVRFVELDGEPVGFSMLMADANEVLAATHGSAGPDSCSATHGSSAVSEPRWCCSSAYGRRSRAGASGAYWPVRSAGSDSAKCRRTGPSTPPGCTSTTGRAAPTWASPVPRPHARTPSTERR